MQNSIDREPVGDELPPVDFDRFFLTQEQVAEFFGVTRSRINQLERKALRNLREAIRQEADAEGISVRDWLAGCI